MSGNARGNLRDVSRPRRERDPSGKAALFSHGAPPFTNDVHDEADNLQPTPKRGATLVLECATCDAQTRVNYLDFVLLTLPIGVWLPLPGLQFNRRMTCPACGQWTWLQAHWFA
jgi:hypothetical protein